MIRINEIALSLDEDESQLKKKAAKILKINEKYIKKYTIYKKSIDARKKDDVHFTYSLDVNISLDEEHNSALIPLLHSWYWLPELLQPSAVPVPSSRCVR